MVGSDKSRRAWPHMRARMVPPPATTRRRFTPPRLMVSIILIMLRSRSPGASSSAAPAETWPNKKPSRPHQGREGAQPPVVPPTFRVALTSPIERKLGATRSEPDNGGWPRSPTQGNLPVQWPGSAGGAHALRNPGVAFSQWPHISVGGSRASYPACCQWRCSLIGAETSLSRERRFTQPALAAARWHRVRPGAHEASESGWRRHWLPTPAR